ncbi:hypothetical protein CSAL01_08055 [Colletotrichum salicis]|uniref:Nephrocystin 3-like N-terminal domain-containing protein n=1 Tax=Colletotrichum salicis TaxID=1209931 RepID=A0A135SFQ8_9PEZI|nr:hypothetical protein CSAL01_08055 [Colletotrichum salicis]
MDSGLTTLASSNASLVKPSPSSFHKYPPEPSPLPADLEEKIECYGFNDHERATVAICALLRQVYEQNSELMDESTVAKFEADGSHLVNSFSGLFDILLEAAKRVETELICLFDALDECNEDDCRQITATLAKHYMKPPKHSRLKFIITSRPYARIRRSLRSLETSIPTIHLRGDDESNTESISAEITIVIHHRLQSIAQIQLLEEEEVKLLEESLFTWQYRTYLWVKLAIDFIESRLESPTRENVQTIFNSVPEKLDGLYEKILERSANKERARKAFHIIRGANRPLDLTEISMALFIERNHQQTSQICQEPMKIFQSYLREIYGLFVAVVGGTVHLLHETAREFLAYQNGYEALQSTWLHSITPNESHLVMAKACVWYILLDDLRPYYSDDSAAGFARMLSGFGAYAFNDWTLHVKECEEHPYNTGSFRDDVVSLCKVTSNYMTRREWMHYSHPLTLEEERRWSEGHEDIFQPEHSNLQDRTPLNFATLYGLQLTASKLLLEDPHGSRKDYERGRTKLWWAAKLGHASIIRLPLTKYVDSEYAEIALHRRQNRYTPLVVAIRGRHKAAAGTLLQDLKISFAAPCGDQPNWKPVHYAPVDKNLFQLLLADQHTVSDVTDEDQHILLDEIFKSGNTQGLKSLLQNGRFENAFRSSDRKNGRPAFCKLADLDSFIPAWAFEEVRLDMMRLLVHELCSRCLEARLQEQVSRVLGSGQERQYDGPILSLVRTTPQT